MGKLTYSKRQMLRKTSFAIPAKRKFPIFDLAHARNALSRVMAYGTLREQGQVKRAVYRRYHELKP